MKQQEIDNLRAGSTIIKVIPYSSIGSNHIYFHEIKYKVMYINNIHILLYTDDSSSNHTFFYDKSDLEFPFWQLNRMPQEDEEIL
jgi:hypothetical protein